MVWGPTLWDQKVCGRIDLTKQSRVDKEKTIFNGFGPSGRTLGIPGDAIGVKVKMYYITEAQMTMIQIIIGLLLYTYQFYHRFTMTCIIIIICHLG